MPNYPEKFNESTDLNPLGRVLFTEIEALRTDLKDVAKELRTVTETIIAIKTENLSAKMLKLEDQVEKLKTFQTTVTASLAVLNGLFVIAMALYSAFKH